MKMRPNGVWSVEVDAGEIYSDSGYTTEPDFSSVSTEEANTAGLAAQAARRGVIMMM